MSKNGTIQIGKFRSANDKGPLRLPVYWCSHFLDFSNIKLELTNTQRFISGFNILH